MTHVTGFWYQLAGTRNSYRKPVSVSWALGNSLLTGHSPCLSSSTNNCLSKGHYCLYLLAVCFNVLSAAVVLLCVLQIVLIVDGVVQNVGNSQREYEKLVVAFSVKNQLRYKGNLGM